MKIKDKEFIKYRMNERAHGRVRSEKMERKM